MLWLSLIVAAIVHVILLNAVKLKLNPQATLTLPILTVLLSKPTRNVEIKTQNEPATSIEHNPVMIKTPQKVFISPSKDVINSLVKTPDSIQSPVETGQLSSDKANIEKAKSNEVISNNRLQNILDGAKEIAREDGRQLAAKEASLNDTKLSGQNALSAAIGGAFRHESASEQKITQHADGMIEVVTVYGTRHCLAPRKNFETGGPVEAEGIPMTCP